MAIYVVETFSNRSGTCNSMWERTFTRTFDVQTDSEFIGPVAIRLLGALPQLGQTYNNGLATSDPLYEFDHGSFVQSIRMDQDSGSNTAWQVTVEYGPFNTGVFGSDPTLWPIRVQHGGERTERVCDFDKTGAPIQNSARDRFADPVTVDDHIKVMTITRNELASTYDPTLASQYSDTINNDVWNGFAARTCKLGIIATSEVRWAPDVEVWYYEVTYPIQVNRVPWIKQLLDQGYNALNGSGLAKPIMRDGQPLSEPVALDGSGNELSPTGTPVVLSFDVFDEADWSGLNLDLSTRLGHP